ncbi:MAG TPA: glycosyltransferase family 2 protein [Pirellulales bacterium]|nr:glycosyltransferase family 2 protein [Pirellulales bacterium]
MDLHSITPLVLTYNEAPNIGRCLGRLRWAREVIVVDSFSTDATVAIAGEYPNTRVVQHAFDDFADQWHWALDHAQIGTEWVLALDADYVVTREFVDEVSRLAPEPSVSAYFARFVYAVMGRPVRGGVYPPVAVLFRRDRCRYRQDGHCYRLVAQHGETRTLEARLVHDDRKSLARWLQSQAGYMEQEAAKLRSAKRLTKVDRLRLYTPFAPLAVLAYSLLIKRGIFDGPAGWFYAFQRAVAEGILQLKLLEHRLGAAPAPQVSEHVNTPIATSGDRTA